MGEDAFKHFTITPQRLPVCQVWIVCGEDAFKHFTITPQRLLGGPRLLQVDPGRGVQVKFFKFEINFGFKIEHKKVFCSSRLRMEQEYRARVEAEGEKQDTS